MRGPWDSGQKVCANGMTARGDIISFSFAHTRDKIQSEIDFVVNQKRVRNMQQEFKSAFDALRRFEFEVVSQGWWKIGELA